MRRKTLHNAKLVVTVRGNKHFSPHSIETVSVFDNRTQKYWTAERIHERGIERFLDVADMKETLNWNLNGDASKYQFKWGQSVKGVSEGRAYVFH